MGSWGISSGDFITCGSSGNFFDANPVLFFTKSYKPIDFKMPELLNSDILPFLSHFAIGR